MQRRAGWPSYLRAYHEERPGITEGLLGRCRPDPYRWLLAGSGLEALRVLDVACGSAPLHPLLKTSHYLGVDTSPGELRAARARGRGPVVQADVGHLPLPDGSVDVVVCSMALQVLTPLPDVLHELARVLAPHGRLVAMVPGTRPLTFRDRLRYARLLGRLRRPRLGYANGGIRRRLLAAGWEIEAQQARRFAYPLRASRDGRRLVDALYLPRTAPARRAAAAGLVGSCHGIELGIPLLRLVARPPSEGRTDTSSGSWWVRPLRRRSGRSV